MSKVENRVVSLTFDNKAFEQRVAATIDSLDKLTKSLDAATAGKTFSDLSKSANNIDLSGIERAIENINDKFSIMGAIGFAVIQKLTNAALDTAKRVVGSALDPILAGGKQRALNIEQALFMFKGIGIDAAAAMESARSAVTGTAYGLDVAAKAAAQFGASGIEVGDQMTGALRGIAGVAAMTSSSFEEIADVFTSAAGKGKISGYELQRIAQRGLNISAAMAKQWNMTEVEVRQMASEGKISFEMFAEAMDNAFGENAQKANETYTGSLANLRAAFARIGASFYGPFLTQQRDVFNSLTPVVDDLHTALKPFIGSLLEITKIKTDNLIKMFNGLDATKLEPGFTSLGNALKNVFVFVNKMGGVFVKAFKNVFPVNTVGLFTTFAKVIEKLTEKLDFSGKTFERIGNILRGFFSIFSIGFAVIKGIASVFVNLFKAIKGGSDPGILKFFSNLGKGLDNLRKTLVDGGGIAKAFENVNGAISRFISRIDLSGPIANVKKFKDAIVDFFKGLDFSGPAKAINDLKTALAGLFKRDGGGGNDAADTADKGASAFERFTGVLKVFGGILQKALDAVASVGRVFVGIGTGIGTIGSALWSIVKAVGSVLGRIGSEVANLFKAIGEGMSNLDFNDALKLVKVGLLGGLVALFAKFLKSGIKIDLGQIDLFNKIGGVLDGVTGNLKAMQQNVKADTLMKIAIALGVLTLSIIALSFVDAEDIAKSLGALTVGLAQLVTTMVALTRVAATPASVGKILALGAGLILLAGAVLILAVAAKILSTMNLEEALIAMGAFLVLLGGLTKVVEPLAENSKGLISAAFGIGLLAGALLILSFALKLLSTIDPVELGTGLAAIAGAMVIFVVSINKIPVVMAKKAGLAIAGIALGLMVFALAVKVMAKLDLFEVGEGLLYMASGLYVLVKTMDALSKNEKNLLETAGAIFILSAAIILMARGLKSMAQLGWAEMAKGLAGVGSTLFLLGMAMKAVETGIAGAAALLLITISLDKLVKVLVNIAEVPWPDLIKGMLGLALILGLLAGAGMLIGPIVAPLMAFGSAIALVGLGLAGFGYAAYSVARAIKIMSTIGEAGIDAFIKVLDVLLVKLPDVATALALASLTFAAAFLSGLDELIPMVVKLLGSLLDGILELAPRLFEVGRTLIIGFLENIRTLYPELVKTGWGILLAFLGGIRDNIGELATTAIGIITEFINAMAAGIPEYVRAMVNLFTTVMTTMATELGYLMATLGPSLGMAFMDGFLTGLSETVQKIKDFFGNWAGQLLDWIKSLFGIKSPSTEMLSIGVDIILGLLQGLVDTVGQVASFFTNLIGDVLRWIGNTTTSLANKGRDFIKGLYDGIVDKAKEVTSWFQALTRNVISWVGGVLSTLFNTGVNLIRGLWEGIDNRIYQVMRWFTGLGSRIVTWVGDLAESLYNVGKSIMDGLYRGMKWVWDQTVAPWLDALNRLIPFKKGPPSYDAIMLVENGKLIMGGLLVGMKSGWETTSSWLSSLDAADALDTKQLTQGVKSAVEKALDAVESITDFNPIITPVLDLTGVQKDAKSLNGLFGNPSLPATASYGQAAMLSAMANTQQETDSVNAQSGPTEIKFEQNNYSPEALSTNDIYRQTRSQIALAKRELDIP
jgi:tape measure domain-containing protein